MYINYDGPSNSIMLPIYCHIAIKPYIANIYIANMGRNIFNFNLSIAIYCEMYEVKLFFFRILGNTKKVIGDVDSSVFRLLSLRAFRILKKKSTF
jgi:hypothetical protein